MQRIIEAQNKNGPIKLKSLPLLAAQNVYKVRLTVIRTVSPAAIKIVCPVKKKHYINDWFYTRTRKRI